MKFSTECSDFLSTEMCINVVEFEQYLEESFVEESQVFDLFVSFMINDSSGKELHAMDSSVCMNKDQEFEDRCFSFLKSHGYGSGDLFEYAYEIFCYFSWFYCGGLLELFKHRQAENKGPKIYLTKRISSEKDISTLPTKIEAYRGMSRAEYEGGNFGMSWSLDIEKAKEFAFTIYSDEPRGVVVKSVLSREMVFYHNPNDSEQEVAIQSNSSVDGLLVCE